MISKQKVYHDFKIARNGGGSTAPLPNQVHPQLSSLLASC